MTQRIIKFSIFIILIITSILTSSEIVLNDGLERDTSKNYEELIIDPATSLKFLRRKQVITQNISNHPFVQFVEEKIETKNSIVQIDFIISRGINESIPLLNITLSGNDNIFQLNETQKYIKVNHSTSGLYNYTLFAENALNNSVSDTIQVFFDKNPPILNVTVFEKYTHHGILIEGYENNKYDVGIDIVEIRLETGNSIIINNFKPYIRKYSNDRLIHIGYDYYPNLFSGNHSIKVVIYDKLGNHSEQNIILYIPSFIKEIENDIDSSNSLVLPLTGSIMIIVLLIWRKRPLKKKPKI